MEELLDRKLEKFSEFLSNRTLGPLNRAGILTVRDLINLDENDLKHIKGFGEKCFNEIKEFEQFLADNGTSIVPKETRLSLDEWISSNIAPRSLLILSQLYGLSDGKKRKLDEVGKEFSVSRERVRQIKQRCLSKIRKGFEREEIFTEILDTFDNLAEQNQNLTEVTELSNVYNNQAMASLLIDITDRNEIFTDKSLKSAWLVKDSAQISGWLKSVLSWLESQPGFVPVDKLSQSSQVPLKVINDLSCVQEDDGYIALVNGYRKDGINKTAVITEVMRQNVNPMSLEEIAEKTGFDKESLRSYIYRAPGVVNVGNSVFALEEYGWSGKDCKTLAEEYLRESEEPRLSRDVIKYVLNRRVVEKASVIAAIDSNPDTFIKLSGGYLALAEWGYKSDVEKIKNKYEVTARNAVTAIMKSAPNQAFSINDLSKAIEKMFGDKASHLYVTISAEIKAMEEEGLVETLGTTTHYYKLK